MTGRARRRGLALCVLSAVCLGSQLASVLHFALVRHARCTEHGDLVHASAPAVGQRAVSAQLRSALTSSYQADPQSVTEHAHDQHCTTCAEWRGSVAATRSAVPYPPELERTRRHAVQSAFDPLGRERWLLAPKSSPPA